MQLAIALAGVCVLIGLLYFNGRNSSSVEKRDTAAANQKNTTAADTLTSFQWEDLEKDVLLRQNKDTAARLMALKGELEGRGPQQQNLRNLGAAYLRLGQPALAAHYYEKAALLTNASEDWKLAGLYYMEGMKAVSDPENDKATVAYLGKQSVSALQKAIELNPKDIDTKVNLALAHIVLSDYSGGADQVMQGVGLLREVQTTNPENRRSLYLLGMLSIRSQQFDKAKERFTALTQMPRNNDPEYPYYFRYLGEINESLHDVAGARAAYLRYQELVKGNEAMETDARMRLKSLDEHEKDHDH